MTRRKQHDYTNDVDVVEMAFVLRTQQQRSVKYIAQYLGVGTKTIYRWLALYSDKESPYWKGTRGKRVRKKRYGDDVKDIVKQLKEEVPERNAMTIWDFMTRRLGTKCPSVETIRRMLREEGYSRGKPVDRKGYVKFERERPNDLWQIDFKGWDYFEHLGKLHLLAIIDDCSRYVVAARWCPTEEESHVIILLRDAVTRLGLPNEILADNGSQFRNNQNEPATRFHRLLTMLGVQVIYHRPKHPQSKGKMERWFGTVMMQFVPEARLAVSKNKRLDLARFNQMFDAWIVRYNTRHKHRSLGGDTPENVYLNSAKRVDRPLEVVVDWDAWIVQSETRKVSKQNIISIKGRKFQLPPGNSGRLVQVRVHDDRYEIHAGDILIDTFIRTSTNDTSTPFVERTIAKAGTFKYKKKTYYVGYKNAGKIVKVQDAVNGRDILVYHDDELLARLDVDDGSVY